MRGSTRVGAALVVGAALTITAGCAAGEGSSETTAASPPISSSSSTHSAASDSVTQETSSTMSLSLSSSTVTSSTTITTTPAPHIRTDPLTGTKLSHRPVIAAKIDNTSFPQFGVAGADIIYTEQVEGGLTRLIAVYHHTMPKEIGAVRSMRSTDMQLLPSYGKIILVNSGGAPANIKRMRASVLVNVTEGFKGLWRSNLRRPPYNLHANLTTIAKDYAGKAPAKDMGFQFSVHDPRLAGARSVTHIDVSMINERMRFAYRGGKYWPSHNGTKYADNDGKKVRVDNVIVQHVRDKPDGIIDPAGNPSFLTTTVGSGKFTLYRDGKAIEGTWKRAKKSDPTTFLDANGKPVNLHPGKTWVLLAPQTSTFNKG